MVVVVVEQQQQQGENMEKGTRMMTASRKDGRRVAKEREMKKKGILGAAATRRNIFDYEFTNLSKSLDIVESKNKEATQQNLEINGMCALCHGKVN